MPDFELASDMEPTGDQPDAMSTSLSTIGLDPENRVEIFVIFTLLVISLGGTTYAYGEWSANAISYAFTVGLLAAIAGALIGAAVGMIGWLVTGGLRELLLYLDMSTSLWVASGAGLGLGAMTVEPFPVLLLFVLVALVVRDWPLVYPVVGTVSLSWVLFAGWFIGAGVGFIWQLPLPGAAAGAVTLPVFGALTNGCLRAQRRIIANPWWTKENVFCWAGTALGIGLLVVPIVLIPSVFFTVPVETTFSTLALNVSLLFMGAGLGLVAAGVIALGSRCIAGLYNLLRRVRT